MKILHTADIHLGVKNGRLSKDKQDLLKDEALHNIRCFFNNAKKEDYDVILICGDLFHSKTISSKFSRTFFDAVEDFQNPVIYVIGNHDESFIMPSILPKNFIILDQNQTCFTYLDFNFYNCLPESLEADKTNILLLHGNIENTRDSDYFDIHKYLNRGFDYIALGHVHQFKKYKSGKDIFVYPGCLFSNGFDENGTKGFVKLEIENKTIKTLEFCIFEARKFVVCEVNVEDLITNLEIINKIENDLKKIETNHKDLVKVILKGAVSEDCEKSIPFILSRLDCYFHIEIEDKTSLKIDIEKIKREKLSFKYEFISLVEESDNNQEIKRQICEIGLQALKGEEINI